jgi:hypothetical protein
MVEKKGTAVTDVPILSIGKDFQTWNIQCAQTGRREVVKMTKKVQRPVVEE